MPFYAMVVVVEAENDDRAWNDVSSWMGIEPDRWEHIPDTRFVGSPWEVKPIDPFDNWTDRMLGEEE